MAGESGTTDLDKDDDSISVLTQEESDKKSAFGPGFRKWLRMKRALRLVHEEKYPDPMHIPRIRYKLRKYWVDSLYGDLAKRRLRNVLDDDSVDDTMIMDAILHRDTHQLLDLLRDGISPDYRVGPLKKTLLQVAAQKGDYDMVDILIASGADVNAIDGNRDSVLYLAMNIPLQFHNLSILWRLFENGADVNYANAAGWTPLHRACLLGEVKLVNAILEMGAEVHRLNAKAMIPLEYVKVNEDEIFSLFKGVATKATKMQHRRMWAHLLSRNFVDALFLNVEPVCSTCKRKVRKCGKMQKENYRHWLFIHKLKKK